MTKVEKIEKKLKALTAKVDEIDEAVDGRITAVEANERDQRKRTEALQVVVAQAQQETQKARKHAQTNQETLVQHATEMGQLRVRHDHAEKDLSRLEHQRDDHVQRFEEIEKDINRLQEQIHELQPKDVDPRQQPEPCEAEPPWPREAAWDGEAAPCGNDPREVRVKLSYLNRLERERDEALQWQKRTQQAKQQARDEVDAAMAEVNALRAQLKDQHQDMQAQAETIDRLDHVLEDRKREVEQLKAYVARKEIENNQLGARLDEDAARGILELLRHFVDDALQNSDGTWDQESQEEADIARCYLARFKDLLPESGCDDEDDEPAPEPLTTPLTAAEVEKAVRPGDGTIPLLEIIQKMQATILLQSRMLGAAALERQPLPQQENRKDAPQRDRNPGEDPDSDGGATAKREVDLGPKPEAADR